MLVGQSSFWGFTFRVRVQPAGASPGGMAPASSRSLLKSQQLEFRRRMLEWICSVSLHICHSYDGLKQAGFLNPVLHVLVRLGVSGDHQKKKKGLVDLSGELAVPPKVPH